MFDVNGTIVIFILSFLLFIWALNQVLLKPVGKVLEARAKLIEDRVADGKASHQQAEELLAKYEEDLVRIRGEAQAAINKAVDEANRLRNSELGKIQADGRAQLEKAQAEIADERASLIDQLVAPLRELVEHTTRKVLGDESVHVSVDEQTVRQTLEEAC
jgi:F-type H+-transporting ATPase subunit b